jgi:hypothetical protein
MSKLKLYDTRDIDGAITIRVGLAAPIVTVMQKAGVVCVHVPGLWISMECAALLQEALEIVASRHRLSARKHEALK